MKKNLFRTVCAAFLCGCMVLGAAMPTLAADRSEDVHLSIYTNRIEYTDGKSAFFDFTGVVPGDTLTQRMIITNRASQAASLHLTAKAPTGDEMWGKLMKQIKLTVYQESNPGNILYMGDLTGSASTAYGNTGGAITSPKSLGKIAAGGEYTLVLRMDVPLEMTNEFAKVSTQSGLAWQMDAAFDEESSSGGSSNPPPSSGGSSGGGVPSPPWTSGGQSTRDRDTSRRYTSGGTTTPDRTQTIPEPEIPLEDYIIADDQIPMRELPKTGSEGSRAIGAWLFAALCAGGIAVKGNQEER